MEQIKQMTPSARASKAIVNSRTPHVAKGYKVNFADKNPGEGKDDEIGKASGADSDSKKASKHS